MSPLPVFLAAGDLRDGDQESEIDPPPVPREALAPDWERFDVETGTVFESRFLIGEVTALKYIEKYEHVTLRELVTERTLGRFPEDDETPLMAFFTARIAFEPNIGSIPVIRRLVRNRAAGAVRDQFEADLADNGLSDIKVVDRDDHELARRMDADVTRYEASFPAPTTEVPLVDDRTLVIDAGDVAVAATLAVWTDGGDVIVAGGAYPAEEFQTTVHESVTEAVELTLDIEMGLDPETYEAEVVDIIEAMIETSK